MQIALMGLGTMGAGMAGRLLAAKLPLTVYNRNPERAAAIAAQGAKVAGSPREAASNADVILSMLSDDRASRAVWLGPDGALAGARKGAIAVESSTVSPAWVQELAAEAVKHGVDFLDAPVTGSRPQAAAGQLLFLAGGDAATLDKIRPVLQPMSRDIVHLGPVGSGARMKLVNNFLCGVQAASLAEALAWVERSGLDREQVLNVLYNGAPGSPMIKAVGARMTARQFDDVYFALQLMEKDMQYAAAEAQSHGVPLRTAQVAVELFDKARTEGWGESDLAAVVEPMRKE